MQFTASGALATIPGGQPISIEDDLTDDQDDPFVADIAIAPNGDRLVSYAMTSSLAKMKLRFAGQGWTTSASTATQAHQVLFQGNRRTVAAFDFVGSGLATERRLGGLDDYLDEDPSWGLNGNGRAPYDIDLGGSDAETVVELALWNGRPLLAGTAADDAGTSGFLLLVESVYVHADGFDQGTPAYWSGAVGLTSFESGTDEEWSDVD